MIPPVPAQARKALRRRIRRLLGFASSLFGAALAATVGWALLQTPGSGSFGLREPPRCGWLCAALGESLARLSYDLPFILRGTLQRPEACIVFLDENAARTLGQRGGVWDRQLHAALVRRLTQEGARAIFFDLIFSDPWPEPGVDEDFAAAMQENGRVFLAAAMEVDAGIGARQERVLPPTATLRRAAAGWGSIAFRPVDADYGIRQLSTGSDLAPVAAWRIAQKLGAALPEEREQQRWLNYYGPAGSLVNVSYDRALAADGVASGFFKDRIVFVGGRSTISELNLGKDEFRNPFSWLGAAFSTGVEVHLTATLNLLHGEWLTRLGARRELWWLIVTGVLLGALLPQCRPHVAALLAMLWISGLGALACWLFARRELWFAWCVPAFAQAPVALGWAVCARYFLEERRRRALRDAFGHYLSPHVADRIADADFDLSPGGTVVEATVLITDLEGFTPLAEELANPELVSRVLIEYFTQTTGHILEAEGTIINFVGDSVLAVWGAPLAQNDHAGRAALAAWRLHADSGIEVTGHTLRTRVGLHTGAVLAGNIGSAKRFDYAVIGDTVNFASRLEGMNKLFGTAILISEALREKLDARFAVRPLGEFRVVGKREAHRVHELLGPASDTAPAPWLASFARGLEAFQRGDFDGCERQMHETLAMRGGSDGPARFYLAQAATLRERKAPENWSGIVELTAK